MGYLLDMASKVPRLQSKPTHSRYELNELNEETESSASCNTSRVKPSVSCADSTRPQIDGNVSWVPEDQNLVDWFLSMDRPKEPFFLADHIRVNDPEKFFAALESEIMAGPNSPRARTGALQSDLMKLREKNGGYILVTL